MPVTSAKRSADDQLWTRLVLLFAGVERDLGKVLQAQGELKASEYRALGLLVTADENELRIQDLSEQLGLDESSVSRLVARMERAGLVQRDLCANDRRGVYAVLTADGRRRHAAVRQAYERALAAALDTAAQDDRLNRLVAALRSSVTR